VLRGVDREELRDEAPRRGRGPDRDVSSHGPSSGEIAWRDARGRRHHAPTAAPSSELTAVGVADHDVNGAAMVREDDKLVARPRGQLNGESCDGARDEAASPRRALGEAVPALESVARLGGERVDERITLRERDPRAQCDGDDCRDGHGLR